MNSVIYYNQFREEYRNWIGNKAANSAILYQHGYIVPKGYAIAYNAIKDIKNISLENRLLTDAFKTLAIPVVLRSSAIDEDSRYKSYAGIYDSVLNVSSVEEYIIALKKVALSASSNVSYNYAPDSRHQMAVLVQELVLADHAGVTFTANPINGFSLEMIIEYFNGLGTTIVGGKTTPQHMIVNKTTKKVKNFIRSTTGVACIPSKYGNCEEICLSGDQVTLLGENEISYIVDVSISIEQLFGCPQDIEWVMKNGTLYIIQSRPITC